MPHPPSWLLWSTATATVWGGATSPAATRRSPRVPGLFGRYRRIPGRRWLNHEQLIDLAAHVLLIAAWRVAGQVGADRQAGVGLGEEGGRPRGIGTFAPG
jgi:hypothetical protein